MTPEQRNRFRVITNPELEQENTKEIKQKANSYQTSPIEKLAKFVNNNTESKFSIEDLLKW